MTDHSFVTVQPNEQDQRKQNEVIRQAMNGKLNCLGSFTLTTGATSTAVTDLRVGTDSVILVMPTTANAAAEWSSGNMYVSSRGKQTFTVTHSNSAAVDRTFEYIAIG